MPQFTKEFIDVTARASNPVSFKNLSYYGATPVKRGGVFCVIYINFSLRQAKRSFEELTARQSPRVHNFFRKFHVSLDAFSSLNAFLVDLRAIGQRIVFY